MFLTNLKKINKLGLRRSLSILTESTNIESLKIPSYFSICDQLLLHNPKEIQELINSMQVHDNFINDQEEHSLINELDPYMKKLRYEFDHWDNAIHGYRETERLEWNSENSKILNRIRKLAFPPHIAQIKYVHVLDLHENGWIKPHIDAVRFCGDTIVGISLLTDSIMRLVHDKNKDLHADILLKRKSLYIMNGTARFDYTHEILSNECSIFKGDKIIKNRRISVICRNEPDPNKII